MNNQSISWDKIKDEFLNNPEFKQEYDALAPEYNLASQVIDIRAITGLTQREFAQKINMKQSQLARIESGKQLPKLETLARLAAGAAYRIQVNFIPLDSQKESELKLLQIDVPDDVKIDLKPVNNQEQKFLESDDPVAIKVRERLNNRPLTDIITQLEKCRNLTDEDEKLLIIKNVLAGDLVVAGVNRNNQNNNIDKIELLELAEDLLEKLTKIWSNK